MHLFSASSSAAVGSAIDLANSVLANCNSIRSADKYASRMELERYDVESCGESLIVHELTVSHTFSRCVYSFAVCLQTRIFDQQFRVSWISFDFNTFWRFSKRWYNPTYYTVQKSYFTHIMELFSRTQCCNVFHE